MLGDIVARLVNRKSRAKPNAFIVSYPKCGRTWLRMLIGQYVCEQSKADPEYALETLRVTREARRIGIVPTTFTHDGSETHQGVPWRPLVSEKAGYRGRRVVLLVRDPRDVMVSCYFQTTKRDMIYEGSISEFIRNVEHGARSYVEFVKAWERDSAIPRDFMVMRYEDMHQDPEGELARVLSFLGCAQIKSADVQRAVRYASFGNMRALEARGQYGSRLTPGNIKDVESFKVRRGKIGGYRDYLDSEDCGYLDQIIRAADCALLECYR